MNKKLKNIIFSTTVISLFSACTHKDVEVFQKGDELLNCQKLTTQIADIMDINSDINSDTGLENKSIASWILWPPLGGYNQINASFERDKIDDRFVVLMKLKQKNGCDITLREKRFIKNKGRLSDKYK